MIEVKSKTSILLFTFISLIPVSAATIDIGISSSEVKTGDSFSLTCTVSDLNADVIFYRGPKEIGSCAASVIPGLPGLCFTGFTQDVTTNITTYSVASANATNDDGTWTCRHQPETSIGLDLTVYGFPVNPIVDNQAYLPNSIDTANMGSTQFILNISECVNPAPTISWTFFQDCEGTSISLIPITSTSSEDPDVACSSPYSAYKNTVTVTDMKNKVNGDHCYKVRAFVGYPETSFSNVTRIFTQNITFTTKGPTTQTSIEYIVGGITTIKFNVELSSSMPFNKKEVTSTSDVNQLMESPYVTNSTVILAYHSTDNLTMKTLDRSVITVTASQSIQDTSVLNISKSSRTDLYFQESSGLPVASLDAPISLYDSFSVQSLNQSIFLSVQTQSHTVSFDYTTNQSYISFNSTIGVPISLQIIHSSEYIIKSSGDISPLTVYLSSGLLSTDLFVMNSVVSLSVSNSVITNPVRLSTYSTNFQSEFIDEITKTLKATSSYFLFELLSSNTLGYSSFMQHNTNIKSTSDLFIPGVSSSDVSLEKKSEDSELHFSNFSSILATFSSYQYMSDTFERAINTKEDISYSLASTQRIMYTESFHTMTNLRDNDISTGDMDTSLKITYLMSDVLIMDSPLNTHLSKTERSGYFLIATQADMKSSSLAMAVSSTNDRYSILPTYTSRHFIHTLQSEVSSQVKGNSVLQSYWHNETPGIDIMSSFFNTFSQPTAKVHSSDTSYHITSKTPTVNMDMFTRITKNDGHVSTLKLSISPIQTGIPADQSIDSSRMKIEFVTKMFGTLSRSEHIELGTSIFAYASSDIFAPSVAPSSDIASTSAYLTSTTNQNVISEQTKDVIVISTATSIICFSVLILLISLFAKKYLQKSKRITDINADQIDWTTKIRLHNRNKKVSSDSLYTADSSIFTKFNTKWYSYSSPYQHNWDDI